MTIVNVFVPILYFIVFFGSVFSINMAQYRRYKQMADAIISHYTTLAVYIKQDVRSNVYTSGARGGYFNRFKRCDLYFMEDSIIIVGYTMLWGKKIHAQPIVLAQHDSAVKKVNPNSFSNEVYIDIEYSGKRLHNIEIHLKGLTDEERGLFTILT